jgi:hypothetical protein
MSGMDVPDHSVRGGVTLRSMDYENLCRDFRLKERPIPKDGNYLEWQRSLLTELEGTGQIYKTMLFTAKDMIDEVCDQVVGDIINSEELSRNWNRSGVRNVRSAAGKSERASVDEKSTDSRAEYARARESLRPSRLTGDTEMVERSDRLVHLGRQVKLIMDQRMSQMYTWLKGSCGENELVKLRQLYCAPRMQQSTGVTCV